jgi:hypothetical protein
MGFALAWPTVALAQGFQVIFQNDSSSAISIFMDERSICTLNSGANCSTPVDGDPSYAHSVRFERGGDSIYDSFSMSECAATGTFIYFIRDDGSSAACDWDW